jgi:DNA-binding transcriptional LysR family regulator
MYYEKAFSDSFQAQHCELSYHALVGAFQASYPDVRVHMTISDRAANRSTSDFHLLVKIGPMKDSSQISRKILTFRAAYWQAPPISKHVWRARNTQ